MTSKRRNPRAAGDARQLIARAERARQSAYAPYSHYRVGAAVIASGQMFDGANVENASFAVSVCAERVAIAQAVVAGARELTAVAVMTGSSPPASPCGVCLQTMAEFAADPAAVQVLLVNDRGEREETTLAALLPRSFRGNALSG